MSDVSSDLLPFPWKPCAWGERQLTPCGTGDSLVQVFQRLVGWLNSFGVMKLGGGCLQRACLFSWITTPLARVSQWNVNSHPLKTATALPCSLAQTCPDWDANGTTQLAQLEFTTSYCCGPPVRPSYSLHAGRCSDITNPLHWPLYAQAVLCNIFILPLGRSVDAMLRSKTGQVRVPVWHLHL